MSYDIFGLRFIHKGINLSQIIEADRWLQASGLGELAR